MNRIAITLAVGLFAVAGCRSDDRRTTTNDVPQTSEPAPEGVGGGPTVIDGWSHEGAIDRLAHSRCEARERCSGAGEPTSDHVSFGECVSTARTELRASFGSAPCESYDNGKVATCARELSDAACGSESKLSDNCAAAKLCP